MADNDPRQEGEAPPPGFIALARKGLLVLVSLVVLVVLGMSLLRSSLTPRPTHDQEMLQAIKTEAEQLMATYRSTAYPGIPKDRQPPAIARLKPRFVMVGSAGVDIRMVPLFSGGWGYEIPRDFGVRPQPRARCDSLGEGVYWCHPY